MDMELYQDAIDEFKEDALRCYKNESTVFLDWVVMEYMTEAVSFSTNGTDDLRGVNDFLYSSARLNCYSTYLDKVSKIFKNTKVYKKIESVLNGDLLLATKDRFCLSKKINFYSVYNIISNHDMTSDERNKVFEDIEMRSLRCETFHAVVDSVLRHANLADDIIFNNVPSKEAVLVFAKAHLSRPDTCVDSLVDEIGFENILSYSETFIRLISLIPKSLLRDVFMSKFEKLNNFFDVVGVSHAEKMAASLLLFLDVCNYTPAAVDFVRGRKEDIIYTGIFSRKIAGIESSKELACVMKNSKLVTYGLLHRDIKVDSEVYFTGYYPGQILKDFYYTSKEITNVEEIKNFLGDINKTTDLTFKHYKHIHDHTRMITEALLMYVKDLNFTTPNKILQKKRAPSILLYGLPGVGKTEYSRVLRDVLNSWSLVETNFFEIKCETDSGEPLSPSQRLSRYKMADALLEKSVVVFDEFEDVCSNRVTISSEDGIKKAYLNKLITDNRNASIWITNSIMGVDDSIIRRFTHVLKFEQLTEEIRANLIKELSPKYNRTKLKYLSSLPLTHSDIVNAFRIIETRDPVFRYMSEHHDNITSYDKFDAELLYVEQILKTRDPNFKLKLPSKKNKNDKWSIDYLNIASKFDHDTILKSLKRTKRSSMLFYGLPGTGKTTYANHLSDKLKLKLTSAKASDILGAYIGENEANIRKLFNSSTGGILFIDEIDTFLGKRTDAARSWEVSMVNEFLVQMEEFDGVLIGCTNNQTMLDEAVCRRFDFKLEFKCLTSEQSVKFFKSMFKNTEIDEKILMSLKRMSLSQGDYGTVLRQQRVYGKKFTPSEFLSALQDEIGYKTASKGIGFLV